MKPGKITPVDRESDFRIHELFFSRTDSRGIIISGNDVFTRVSGYTLEEMIHKPHSMIRHPDMPKAIFKLFWDFLKQGKPIAAYVKNMSRDGRYYWVYAMAFPVDGGYVSIRLKPSSEIFALIPNLYKEILDHEQQTNMDSALNFTQEKLKSLGFASYEEYMAKSLITEIASRDKALAANRHQEKLTAEYHGSESRFIKMMQTSGVCTSNSHTYTKVFQSLGKTVSLGEKFGGLSTQVLEQCKSLHYLAINMATESERAGSAGLSMAVVSEKFRAWAGEIQEAITAFEQRMTQFHQKSRQTEVAVAVSRFQMEIMSYFIANTMETLASGKSFSEEQTQDLEQNIQLLFNLCFKNVGQADFETSALSDMFRRLNSTLNQIQMSLTGMEVIRLSGRIESVRVDQHNINFNTHVQGMMDFIANVKKNLIEMEKISTLMLTSLKEISGDVMRVKVGLATLDHLTDNFHALEKEHSKQANDLNEKLHQPAS